MAVDDAVVNRNDAACCDESQGGVMLSAPRNALCAFARNIFSTLVTPPMPSFVEEVPQQATDTPVTKA